MIPTHKTRLCPRTRVPTLSITSSIESRGVHNRRIELLTSATPLRRPPSTERWPPTSRPTNRRQVGVCRHAEAAETAQIRCAKVRKASPLEL